MVERIDSFVRCCGNGACARLPPGCRHEIKVGQYRASTSAACHCAGPDVLHHFSFALEVGKIIPCSQAIVKEPSLFRPTWTSHQAAMSSSSASCNTAYDTRGCSYIVASSSLSHMKVPSSRLMNTRPVSVHDHASAPSSGYEPSFFSKNSG